jgi:hypothetical protein
MQGIQKASVGHLQVLWFAVIASHEPACNGQDWKRERSTKISVAFVDRDNKLC